METSLWPCLMETLAMAVPDGDLAMAVPSGDHAMAVADGVLGKMRQ
jgi:hypothetical protein